MKYFTYNWCTSKLSEKDIEDNLTNYRIYIDSIYDKLPFVLKLLVKNINLHDGKIKNASFNSKESNFTLKGVFGDLQTGYYFLEINYINIKELNKALLKTIFVNQALEILSDEIEMLAPSLFSHRILFSTKQTFEIQFSDLTIKITTATPKDYNDVLCHYRENVKPLYIGRSQ